MLDILSSRMKTPDGTILESINRHDYVTHTDANGKEYMLDGGCEYVRCSANGDEYLLTIYTDYPHELIRLHSKWGTYGKQSDQPLSYVAIADMETGHLQACLDTQKSTMRPALYKVMQDEVKYRKRCGDCGQFVRRDLWLDKEKHPKAVHALCTGCKAGYDDCRYY